MEKHEPCDQAPRIFGTPRPRYFVRRSGSVIPNDLVEIREMSPHTDFNADTAVLRTQSGSDEPGCVVDDSSSLRADTHTAGDWYPRGEGNRQRGSAG
jgi:hypothetical protein